MSRHPWFDHRRCAACDDEARYPSKFCEFHRDLRRASDMMWQGPLLIVVLLVVYLAIKYHW